MKEILFKNLQLHEKFYSDKALCFEKIKISKTQYSDVAEGYKTSVKPVSYNTKIVYQK